MKLDLRGHQEKYVIEQSMLNLFPGETPVYGTVDELDNKNNNYAIVGLSEENLNNNIKCRVWVKICYRGAYGENIQEDILSGGEYAQEGQRRYILGKCFFLAAREILKINPPWGMLSGVRPDKIIARFLLSGKSDTEARDLLQEKYFVEPKRAEMALKTGQAAFEIRRDLNLNNNINNNICVYIGIPFCPTRCAYCSFVSQSVEKSWNLIEPYVDALESEIINGGKVIKDLNLKIRAFYMGGGTPTSLSAADLNRILKAVEKNLNLSDCTERTVEAGRPDTITEDKLKALKDNNITRISINPQSMNDEVLKAIGRRHTVKDTENAMNLAARLGFDWINMDLIAGLPKDNLNGFIKSLDACMEFQPANLTVHTLALKKGSKILIENQAAPDASDVENMLNYAYDKLYLTGYAPYYLYRQKYMSGGFENTGWSKFHANCIYNICEMSELCGILAFGAGGATKLIKFDPQNPERVQIKRVFHAKYPEEYLSGIEKRRDNWKIISDFYAGLS